MRIEILPTAREDLADGFAFYEKQQRGLGTYFLNSLFADVDSLTIHAGQHRRVYGAHRLLSRVFPFAVYSDVLHDMAKVKAILDCRRDPKWIEKRLRRGR